MINIRTITFLCLVSPFLFVAPLYADKPPIGVYHAITESEWTQEVTLGKSGEAQIVTDSWDPDDNDKHYQNKVKCSWKGKVNKISLRCNDELLTLKFVGKLSALDLTGPPEESGPALVVVSSTKSGKLSALSARRLWREDFGRKLLDRIYQPKKKEESKDMDPTLPQKSIADRNPVQVRGAGDRESDMVAKSGIFPIIDRVIRMLPLNEASVSNLFGVGLKHLPDPGNPFIRILTAEIPDEYPFQKLELRVPTEGRSAQALLILITRPSGRIAIAEVRKHYGAPAQVELPQASAPLGTPTYESYPYKWGRLTFGFLSAQNNSVSEVIVDRK